MSGGRKKQDRGRRGELDSLYVEEGDDNPHLGFANEINLRRNYNNYSDFNLRFKIPI